MSARADAAAATGQRILDATRARFNQHQYDDLTLEMIAEDAGVTVKTVLRRFGSKEGLVRAVADAARSEVLAQRDRAPVGDVDGAIANLVEHYEANGDEAIHLLRQEQRVPALAELAAGGRAYHASWVDRVFEPWLRELTATDRRRRRAQLIAACDVYTWYLVRRQGGLSRTATRLAMRELVEGVLP